MRKSFTLIELLVSISIFVIVSLVTIIVLSTIVSSKSKIIGMNELRAEANKIMTEIQNMIETGNTRFPGDNLLGVAVENGPGLYVSGCPINLNIASTNKGIVSINTDTKGNSITSTLRFDGTNKKITLQKGTFLPIDLTSSQIKVNGLTINGWQRRVGAGCSNNAAYYTISLELEAKTTGGTGLATKINLLSTFAPKYPNPDQAGDSL